MRLCIRTAGAVPCEQLPPQGLSGQVCNRLHSKQNQESKIKRSK
uniref:Uncharacterized protein n=1 Tax=Setaria viridis TaxID=4556 RepID=A0A4U6USA9_SETVI|nr:hypothetical protein SEVIR_5G419532v2 [Setaria viridis]